LAQVSKVGEAGLVFRTWHLDGRSRVGVLIEILEVGAAGKFGHPRWLNFLRRYHVPVYSSEPNMIFDVLSSVHHAAQTLGQVWLE